MNAHKKTMDFYDSVSNLHSIYNNNTSFKVSFIYAGFSILWILFSDQILLQIIKNADALTNAQMLKGWAFVIVTATIIFFLLKKEVTRLKETENILWATLESTLDGILVISNEGKVIASNSQFAKMWSIPQEILVGKTDDQSLLEYAHNLVEDPEGFFRQIDELYQSSEDNFDVIKLKGGKVFERYTTPLTHASVHRGRVWCFHDISGQKHTQDELAESEEKYRTLFETANDAILTIEGDLFVECNTKALELFACNRDQLTGKPPYLLSPEHQPDGSDSKEKALEKIHLTMAGTPQFFEWRHLKHDGTAFDVEVSLNRIELSGETFLQTILRDITARKAAENQLLKREEQQSLILRTLPMAFYVAQPLSTHGFSWISPQIENISGMSPEKFIENISFWEERIHPEDKDHALSSFDKIYEQGTISVDYRWKVSDGTYHWFHDEATLIRNNKEPQNEIVGTLLNITDRKALEEQLAQAQKMEAIGTLAGGIAHDFNNILSAIFGYIDFAKEDINDPDTLRQDIDGISSGAERAKELVRQILTFSRKSKQEKMELQVSLVIREALKLIRSSIPTTIDIKHNIANSHALVLADPTQIHQIVMNLCTNAYHAMEKTGGTLSVALKEVEISAINTSAELNLTAGRYLKLEVSDTGAGMDKETKTKIFEPYFTTKKLGEGTGLGLAVVHGAVKDHGGTINVFSEPGKGTSIQIFFPVYECESDETIPKRNDTPIEGGNETIMFVDDDIAITNIAKKILDASGYMVISYPNGVKAYQELQQQPNKYDLLITDMTMPGFTGLDLFQKAKKTCPDLPVILCTGHSKLINREKALALGVSSYCEKPMNTQQLLLSVRKVLDDAKCQINSV